MNINKMPHVKVKRAMRNYGLAITAGITMSLSGQTITRATPPLVITEKGLSIIGDLGTFHASWECQSPEANLI